MRYQFERFGWTRWLVLPLLLAIACAPARVAPGEVENGDVVVRVDDNLIPTHMITVYAVPEVGARMMLGTVMPQESETFEMTPVAAGPYRLLARTVAGAEMVSERFTPLEPGLVEWTLSPNIVTVTPGEVEVIETDEDDEDTG